MHHEQPTIKEQEPTPTAQGPSAIGDPPMPQAEQHEQDNTLQPRIWVASLADYNNGGLHGTWLDAARETEEIEADIQTMLAGSPWTARTGEPAEEWGIFDYENFGHCRIDQHEDLDWVSGVAQGIAEHGLAFAAWADVVEEPMLLLDFDEAYLGHYDSLQAYVEQLINDLGYDRILDGALPASIRPYVKIDISGTANDLLHGGDLHALTATNGGVWIFNAR